METLHNTPSVVDFSQASSFSQLPDEDFLALLQKEFPNGSYDFNGINPQSILNYPLPTLTPPSEDSSPSPQSARDESSSSPHADNDENPESALKRKASDEDLEEGPSQKSQHTSNNKKASSSTTRRKSSGTAPPKEESKLLKRKEQNRAAQRAFRERKEKHVKDLEDKVAALEAKNEQTQTENDNLKDLLSRLQTENVLLRSATFTFSMPKSTEGAQYSQSSSTDASLNLFSPSSDPSSAVSPTNASPSTASPKPNFLSSIDWNALTTFDPSMLSALDEGPQPTASGSSISMDFALDENAGPSNSSYTTIANNPTFMSFAAMFDSTPTPSTNESAPFSYDMSSVMSTWSPPPSNDANTLDDLFGGMLGTQQPPVDFNVLMTSSPSLSPVSHHNSINGRSPADSASTISPSSKDPPTDKVDLSQHRDCPKTKAEVEQAVKYSSPFAPSTMVTGDPAKSDSPFAPSAPTVRKSVDSALVPMVACQGSTFPSIEKSDQNIEVLSAWKTIRSNPQFKDVDINDLCSEFTSKARCDGTKVVLEPQGVHNIIETLKHKAH